MVESIKFKVKIELSIYSLFKLSFNMRVKFKKTKTEHHIIQDFKKLLIEIEKNEDIIRIIPWRIDRKQKGSSEKIFRITIPTNSGFKCIMSKWSTAQELFVIFDKENFEKISNYIKDSVEKFNIKYLE